jgi:ribosomal protein S1
MGRTHRYDQSDEAWERFRREFTIGARLVGTVADHAPFGIFIDLGWPIPGLVLPGNFPGDRDDPKDYPLLGSPVEVEVKALTGNEKQVYVRLLHGSAAQPFAEHDISSGP